MQLAHLCRPSGRHDMILPPDMPQTGARRDDLPLPPSVGDVRPLTGVLLEVHRHLVLARRSRRYLALLAVTATPVPLDGADEQVLLTDELAVQLGRRVQSRVRAVDKVLPQGGFDHLALLPDCRPPGAMAAVQRLRAALGGTYRVGTRRLQLQVSVGVACFPSASDTAQGLLAVALQDRARQMGS
jgi:predicted signal transduction protein with EAL and GGDEF domain